MEHMKNNDFFIDFFERRAFGYFPKTLFKRRNPIFMKNQEKEKERFAVKKTTFRV